MVCTGRLLEEPTLGKLVVWNASLRKDTFRLKHRYGLANVKNRSVSEIYILPCPLHASVHCLNSPTTTDSWLCFHPGCRSGSFPILKRLGSCLHQGWLPYCESVSGRISVLLAQQPWAPFEQRLSVLSTCAPGTELVLLWMRPSMSSVDPQNRSEVKLCQKLGCALISDAFLLFINDWEYLDLRKALILCVTGHAFSRVACVHTAILGLFGTQ